MWEKFLKPDGPKLKIEVTRISAPEVSKCVEEMRNLNNNLNQDQIDMLDLIEKKADSIIKKNNHYEKIGKSNPTTEKFFLVAKNEDGIACGMTLMDRKKDMDYLDIIVSAIIGRGIGKSLNDKLIDLNRERDPRVPLVNKPYNENVRVMYERNGLVPFGNTDDMLQRVPSQTEITPSVKITEGEKKSTLPSNGTSSSIQKRNIKPKR